MSGSDSGRVVSTVATQVTPISRTAVAGFALQNGTPNILQFTTPNDGLMHAYTVAIGVNVTVAQTGGGVSAQYTSLGHVYNPSLVGGNAGVGNSSDSVSFTADPNTTVTVYQATAQTLGAATVVAAVTGG